jgi:hypothetical protein
MPKLLVPPAPTETEEYDKVFAGPAAGKDAAR